MTWWCHLLHLQHRIQNVHPEVLFCSARFYRLVIWVTVNFLPAQNSLAFLIRRQGVSTHRPDAFFFVVTWVHVLSTIWCSIRTLTEVLCYTWLADSDNWRRTEGVHMGLINWSQIECSPELVLPYSVLNVISGFPISFSTLLVAIDCCFVLKTKNVCKNARISFFFFPTPISVFLQYCCVHNERNRHDVYCVKLRVSVLTSCHLQWKISYSRVGLSCRMCRLSVALFFMILTPVIFFFLCVPIYSVFY